MANRKHVDILKKGVSIWNEWRKSNPAVIPDLSWALLKGRDLERIDMHSVNMIGIMLDEANLQFANLSDSHLNEAFLNRANLTCCNLTRANLREAALMFAILREANLFEARLQKAMLYGADFYHADMQGVDLSSANLSEASLVRTNLQNAIITGSRVYGISAWELELKGAQQNDLNILKTDTGRITVDSIELAQFMHLILRSEKLRQVIDTITSKVVLILGRFSGERKVVLDMVRDATRQHGYSPVLFDFEKPLSRTTMETVSTLAHMSRFVIADLTNARSVLQELRSIVPELPSVPVQPIIQSYDDEPGMIDFFKRYPWFLPVQRYNHVEELLAQLERKVFIPLEAMIVHAAAQGKKKR